MGSNKVPLIKWADLQGRRPSLTEIIQWPKQNLAIITGEISNLVVVDLESEADARWFWDHRSKSPTVVKSRRGYHLYFKHPGERVANSQKREGFPYDVRGDGGYVLAPPSSHSEGRYLWQSPLIPTDNLPTFRLEWRPQAVGLSPGGNWKSPTKQYTDGVAYIAKIRAVSGQGGHDDTYRAACTLRDAGLSEGEALLAMQSWNETNADPPWSNHELLHKLKSAYRNVEA